MAATIWLRPVDRRANFRAASTASVPELQKKTRSNPGDRAQILLHQLGPPVVVERFRQGDQPLGLFRNRRGDLRVSMAQVGYAMPAHAVDVFSPIGVPQESALASDDCLGMFGVKTAGMGVFAGKDISHNLSL